MDKLVTGAGGNLNASTSFDQTDFYINLPANQYKLALWIESERMMHGKVEQIGVDTQRQVVKEERRRSYDNQPYGSLFEELAKLVFAGTPVCLGAHRQRAVHRPGDARRIPAVLPHLLPAQQRDLRAGGRFRSRHGEEGHRSLFRPHPARPRAAPAQERCKITPRPAQRPENGGKPMEVISEFPVGDPSKPGNNAQYTLYGQRGKTIEIEKQNTPLPATLHAWLAPTETDPDSYARSNS